MAAEAECVNPGRGDQALQEHGPCRVTSGPCRAPDHARGHALSARHPGRNLLLSKSAGRHPEMFGFARLSCSGNGIQVIGPYNCPL